MFKKTTSLWLALDLLLALLAWSPDGTRLASGDEQGSIRIWVHIDSTDE